MGTNAPGDTVIVYGENLVQFEVGLVRLAEARATLFEDGQPTVEALELAATQLAMTMAVSSEETPRVPSLSDRIQNLRDRNNPNRMPTEANFFSVEEALTEKERAFLPATQTVIGLIYQAARFTS